MKISEILTITKYKPDHLCKTPDAVYTSTVSSDTVAMSVKLPFKLELTKPNVVKLEAQLHYAFEEILSKYFK